MSAWYDKVHALLLEANATRDPVELEKIAKKLDRIQAITTAAYVRSLAEEYKKAQVAK